MTGEAWAEAEGLAALDHYDRAGDPGDLRVAERVLSLVLSDRPDHPDRFRWAARLSDAFTERADDGDGIEDYDSAITWTRLLVAEAELDGFDRDVALVRLADLTWDRSWAVAPEESQAVDELLGELTTMGGSPTVARYLRVMHGIALTDAEDVDAAIDVLAPALEELIGGDWAEWVSDGRLALAAFSLAGAYHRRGDLDRAVAVLERALAEHASNPAASASLCTQLALALQERWHRRLVAGDEAAARTDLESAVAACEQAGESDDPWSLALHGELLSARAELDGRDDDARAAAELLSRAAAMAAGDPDGWRLWWSAATANRVADRLDAAADQLRRALTSPMGDDDRLAIHADLVEVERQPGRTDRLRDAVDAGIAALAAATGAETGRRAGMALILAYASYAAAGADLGEVDTIGIRRLLDLAADHPEADDEWQALVDYGVGVIEHYEDMLGSSRPGDGGLRRLARAAAFQHPDADFAERLRLVVALAGQAKSGHSGDRRAGQAARRQADPERPLPERTDQAGQDQVSRLDREVVEIYSRLMERLQAGDAAGAAAAAREALPVLDGADLSAVDQMFLTMVRAVAAIGDPRNTPPLEIPEIEPGLGMGATVRLAGALTTAAAALGQAMSHHDIDRVRQIAGRVERMMTATTPPRNMWIAGAGLAGQAYLMAGEAEQAADWLGRALTDAGGVGFPLWAQLAMERGEALRRSGGADPAAGRELGMSALQGHAWQVFAQAGADNSIASAKRAAADARRVAGWCLADRRRDPAALEQLVAVLDAGRGLVLRATTTSRAIVDRLTGAGHADLAAEWTATAGGGRDMVTGLAMPGGLGSQGTEIPDDLRLRVLRTLGGDQVLGYEPIATREIRQALRATGTQALVYLLAAEEGRDGAAVVVPAGGAPIVVTLPRLETGPNSPVRWYVRTQPHAPRTRAVSTGPERGPEDRDLGPVADITDPDHGLADLCAWAWEAAMSVVLRVVRGGPERRIVLIPMGMLALVPWHAAVDRTAGRRRYAAEEAVISYSPSARAFCTSAARPPSPITSALFVGDPTGDLPYAGAEARAIRDRFYPAGLFARRPEEVLDWVGSRPTGGAVLHFACHGAVDPRRPADAHLVLADHAGLTARTLLESSHHAELDVREVFLAACTTSVSGHDHDEVLSLASAFLAAGAHTVFGSLWPVPDGTTSLLMFKLHGYLRVDGLPPADALRRAQLWMLDPGRDVSDVPPALLQDYRDGTEFALTSWAGFTHIGR